NSQAMPSGRIPSDVPGFVVNLWHLVQDPAAQQLISWSYDGKSFLITDGNLLAREVLPCYFKHSNLSSFVRQLNLYSFRKMIRPDLITEFAHPCFQRDSPHRMSEIRRVPQNSAAAAAAANKGRVRSDLASVKAKQSGNEEELTRLRTENQQLWLEVQYLRQQQRHHQDAVRWLLNFFSLLMPKRRAPAQMAIESGQPVAKRQRLATFSCSGGDVGSSGGAGVGTSSAEGEVTIEDVTEFLMSSDSPQASVAVAAAAAALPPPRQQQQQQQIGFNDEQLQTEQSPVDSQSEPALSSDIDSIVGSSSMNLPSPMHQMFDNPNQLPPLDAFLDFIDPASSHEADNQLLSLLADPSEQLHVSLEEFVEPQPQPQPDSAQASPSQSASSVEESESSAANKSKQALVPHPLSG
ncbi:hypothetical protein BOX15_Mlig001228g7, partial [Macrostomum lignano]